MSQHVRIEGYAIVFADGLIADHDRKMIDGLKIDDPEGTSFRSTHCAAAMPADILSISAWCGTLA